MTTMQQHSLRSIPAHRSRGFTLIELMITVVIATILISIALPMYQSEVRKSRRTDAKSALLDAASREERYFSLNNSYTVSAANLGYSQLPIQVGSSSTNYYTLAVCIGTSTVSTASTTSCAGNANTTGTSYIVYAVPIAGLSQAQDASCQYFAVDNTGAQYASTGGAGSGTDTSSTCRH